MKKICTILYLLLSGYCSLAQCADVTLTSQTEVDAFFLNGCTTVTGSLIITTDNPLVSPITDLSGLTTITSITGGLYIHDNPSLQYLTGLTSIHTVGTYLDISNNPALVSLSGLGSITSLGWYIVIHNNDELITLGGLSGITAITGYLSVDDNLKLNNLTGLGFVTSISQYVDIYQNPSMSSLAGLGSLKTVGDYLNIYDNGKLQNLQGLEKLESVAGDLTITDNSNDVDDTGLLTLSGLSATSFRLSIGGTLNVHGNHKLSTCALKVICTYLSGTGNVNIFDNNPDITGCFDLSAVEDACQAALPVTLSRFEIAKENQAVVLSWSTTAETNSDRFEIEHSATAKMWNKIGDVKASGNITGSKQYTFTDSKPSGESNYYRLKLIDLDGSSTYSTIKNVSFEPSEKAKTTFFYPNPVSEKLYFDNSVNLQTVRFFDASGKIITERNRDLTAGVSVNSLVNGIYVVKFVRNGGEIISAKIIVSK